MGKFPETTVWIRRLCVEGVAGVPDGLSVVESVLGVGGWMSQMLKAPHIRYIALVSVDRWCVSAVSKYDSET